MRAFERFARRYSYQLMSAIAQLIGIWLIYVYSNSVDVEEFALFVVINVINGAVTVLFSFGYNPIFLKRMSSPGVDKEVELNRYISFSCVSGFLAILFASVVLRLFWTYSLGKEYIMFGVFYWSCTFGMTALNFVLNSVHRFEILGLFQLGHVVGKAIVFFLLLGLSPLSLLLAHTLSGIVVGLLVLRYFRQRAFRVRWDWPRLRILWKESRFLYAESYANYLSKEFDSVLVTAIAPKKFLVSFYILQRVQKVFVVMYSTFEKEDLSFALKGQRNGRRMERLVLLGCLTLGGIVSVVLFLPGLFNKLDPAMAPYISLMLSGLLLSYCTYTRLRIDLFVEQGARARLAVTLWYLLSGYALLALMFPIFGSKVLFAFHLSGSFGMLIYIACFVLRAKRGHSS